MKIALCLLILFLKTGLCAQPKKPEDFGFRHIQLFYKGDTVDVLLKSKKGDEQKKKPLFLFCQGSQPKPLLIVEGQRIYSVFPFKTDSIETDYHLAIIGKPFVPLLAQANTLGTDFNYQDPKTKTQPRDYSKRNLPEYYVQRNLHVITALQKLAFIARSKLVVAGHSEGSDIAARLAAGSNKITHLIYASGNPLGRITDIVEKDRAAESDTDSTRFAEEDFVYWADVVNNKNNMDDSNGDTYKATYDFSYPPIKYLERLAIPVLVCYGTKDCSSPYNDYLRVEMLRQHKKNITFKAYIGLEHNFFPLTPEGKPDFSKFNWDKVGNDWWRWAR